MELVGGIIRSNVHFFTEAILCEWKIFQRVVALHLRADKSSYGSLEFLQQFHLFELLFSFWQNAFFESKKRHRIHQPS